MLRATAERTDALLAASDAFADQVRDTRLGLEIAVINRLAHRLTRLLMIRDPLSERVHLGAPSVAALTLGTVTTRLIRFPRRPAVQAS